MDLCIVVWLSTYTNKMQLCNRIYYSKVYWRLNMFRTACRSSSGALNYICSLWFVYPCGDRPLSRLSGKWIQMDAACNRIYYSKVYWRLNMFWAAHRSSSGALNCICSLWFVYPCGDRPLSRLSGLHNGRSPHGYINQRLHIQFRAPDDKRCAARNMLSLQ